MPLSQQDLAQIAQRDIRKEQIETQLNQFMTGFPFLHLEAAAAVGKGIIAPSAAERNDFVAQWEQYKNEGHRVVKFVPASGAASRMFKNMFAFVDADYDTPATDFEKTYFGEIEKCAFYDALDAICRKNEGAGIKDLIAAGQYKAVAANSCPRVCCCSTNMRMAMHAPLWRSIWWRAPSTQPAMVRRTFTSP